MKATGLLRGALAAATAALGLASGASAMTITAPTIVDSTTLTTGTDTAGVKGSQVVSTSSTGFTTRYYTTVSADRGSLSSGTVTATTSVSYTITFSVTHTNGVNYQIDITNAIAGALSTDDDAAGLASSGSASVTNVTGSQTAGGGTLTGSLSPASAASIGGTSSTTIQNTAVSKSTLATIFAVGTGAAQTYTLKFTWTAQAQAPGNLASGSDEEAARFGLATATGSVQSSATADDYPSNDARNGLNDGQKITVFVTPEPGTVMLLGFGLAGLTLVGSRKQS